MPRKGKGQKVQAATGQTYGTATAQKKSQAVVPLAAQPPIPTSPTSAPPASQPRAGAQPFDRPSERPNEPVTASGSLQLPQTPADPERRFRAAMMLPIVEQMASQKGASPSLRNSVRKLKLFVGDVSEFADRNP